ncbi:MAG: hypothetical protein AAFN93_19315 [Bacteroidota bacterium]
MTKEAVKKIIRTIIESTDSLYPREKNKPVDRTVELYEQRINRPLEDQNDIVRRFQFDRDGRLISEVLVDEVDNTVETYEC